MFVLAHQNEHYVVANGSCNSICPEQQIETIRIFERILSKYIYTICTSVEM